MISPRPICDTPLAIVDLETTGFSPGGDKIVEVAVARVDPGVAPILVLNTLVDPQRPMAATEIHGIAEHDVVGAPTFSDIAGNVVDSLQGAALGAYNVYFDLKFLQSEFKAAGVDFLPPYLCMMYMRPMLTLGDKCTLSAACKAHGITGDSTHMAGSDVLATAQLWQFYTTILAARGITTFEDLAKLKSYKFTRSFSAAPLDGTTGAALRRATRLQPRSAPVAGSVPGGTQAPQGQSCVAEYWDAVVTALADLEIYPQEATMLSRYRGALDLNDGEVRWVHARVFSGLLAEASQDRIIQANEAEVLFRVAQALRILGWAPGDSLTETGNGAPQVAPRGFWSRLFG